ncbi:MAG: radical SAM protein [Deltaproteobacteria bacterium]|nr:radical SAM protein [Deltaproteobacteria bacterium]
MKNKRLIIPIFIPFAGCPHQCIFCNQEDITGSRGLPSIDEIRAAVEKHLSTWKHAGVKEIAFYGGSFTGLPLELQEEFLGTAYGYVRADRIDSIRISTRPDYINEATPLFLKRFLVKTVELGAESMCDDVLKLSNRGHTALDTIRAAAILKEAGLSTGLQLMPGLPGDTRETIIESAKKAVRLKPDFVRIYPTLVLKDTTLHEMYKRGSYKPWSLSDMVSLCKEVADIYKSASIPIIRMGLQPTRELEKSLVAGPYHPAFRELVYGQVEQRL